MKIAFIVVAALMVALALAALLVPLVREGRRSGHTRGVFVLCLSIALLLPLGAGVLYLKVGTPAALNGVSAQAQTPISLPQAIAQLREHLAQQPDDQQGWMLLAQTSAMMRQPGDARDAWDHVLKLDANNAEAMVGWAESDSMLRADHQIDGRARELLQRAVKQHPDNQRGLWLLGISDFQRGDYRSAAATWRLLQPQLEPGSSVAQSVAEQIAIADARAGGAPADASGSAAAAVPAGASLQVNVTLAPALQAKLAKGDVLYVYARAPDGPPMPLAVARIEPVKLPVTVTLNDAMAMTPAYKLSSVARVFVGARISHDGRPTAAPGDLEGDAGVVEVARKTPVAITIDKVR
ncbi:MAG: tetratricopeptide repeat protein [Rhodanobacter sp.]